MQLTQYQIQKIQQYIDEGYIAKRKHPEYDIWILSYTHQTQYDWKWDSITKMCRGLVVDVDWNIIAKPFEKFFTYEQLQDMNISLPNEEYDVFEKIDGSMVIGTKYKGENILCTKGSFTSEQAQWANEIFPKYNYDLQENITYLWELIDYRNQIVVDYGEKQELVLLAMIDTKSGEEYTIGEKFIHNSREGGIYQVGKHFPIVKKHKQKDIDKLLEQDKENAEGYVLRFTPSGFRVKIKFDTYLEIHRFISHTSEKTVFEYLSDPEKDFDEFLQNVPDEYYSWVKEVRGTFESTYSTIKGLSNRFFDEIIHHLNLTSVDFSISEKEYRKRFALEVINNDRYKKYAPVLFALYDEKDIEPYIWKQVKKEHDI